MYFFIVIILIVVDCYIDLLSAVELNFSYFPIVYSAFSQAVRQVKQIGTQKFERQEIVKWKNRQQLNIIYNIHC